MKLTEYQTLMWAIAAAVAFVMAAILYAVMAHAQQLPPIAVKQGQNLMLPIVGSTPVPTPTPNPVQVHVYPTANGWSVGGSNDKGGWVNLTEDGVFVGSSPKGSEFAWTGPIPPGQHTFQVDGYRVGGVHDGTAVKTVSVPTPSPTPSPSPSQTPTSTPTPAPTPSPSPSATPSPTPVPTQTPIADSWRPTNTVPNNTAPTAAQLAAFVAAVQNYSEHYDGIDAAGNKHYGLFALPYAQQLDGAFKGTTQQIVYHYAAKWLTPYAQPLGIDPGAWLLAECTNETTGPDRTNPGCYQKHFTNGGWVLGDIGNGGSVSLMQIKTFPGDAPGCPTFAASQNPVDLDNPDCMFANSTPFAMDFQASVLRACMDGAAAAYLADGRDFGVKNGFESYPTAVANKDLNLWLGCTDFWNSGSWFNGNSQYHTAIANYYNHPTWPAMTWTANPVLTLPKHKPLTLKHIR